MGIIEYIKEFLSDQQNSFHAVSLERNQNLAVFFNCHFQSIEKLIRKPVPKDGSEFSFM